MALSRRTWTWIGLAVACVVIWLVADSQGNQILDLNATGAFLTLLKVLWTVSLLGFIVLVLFGVFTVVRARMRRSRAGS
jgi:fucose permease